MKIIDKPWGTEIIWASTDSYMAKILTIAPGQSAPKQYHIMKEKTFYVSKGQLVMESGKKTLIMNPGASYHVPPDTIYKLKSPSQGCTLIEVSTPETNDVVLLEKDLTST